MQHAFRGPGFSFKWGPVAPVVAGGSLAFVIWTLPNWGDFSLVISEWGDLWQIPENRLPIIALTVKILSPLFLMTMIGLVVRIWSLIRSSSQGVVRVREQESMVSPVDRHASITSIPETLESGEPFIPISPVDGEVAPPVISIRLLKDIMMVINVPGEDSVEVKIASNVKFQSDHTGSPRRETS